MTLIWLVFTLILFVLEPLFLHHWFHEQAKKNSTEAFSQVHRLIKFYWRLAGMPVARNTAFRIH
jgi:hypothetical protein